MSDPNSIIEIINDSLPILATSPVMVKLIDVVGDIVKTLYLPTLTLKKGKAEVDVDIYRKKQTAALETQSFTLYEITKLKNFIKTASFAAENLANTDSCSDNPIDFDWIMRFFDAVGSISNEELQKLWGKILAGEVKNPGNCSLRTIDIVRNLSKNEANIFNEICKYILISGDCHFIFSNGFESLNENNENSRNIIISNGWKYSTHIIPLIESGLLSIDNTLATDFKTDNTLVVHNKKIVFFVVAEDNTDVLLSLDAYFLTSCGVELFNIISHNDDFEADIDYAVSCFKEFKKQYSDLKFFANNLNSDKEDNLSDNILI